MKFLDNIAIIGMGCLYPNYVTKKDFWQKLLNGEDFMVEASFVNRKIERASIPKDRSEEFFKNFFTKEEYEELDSYGELFKWVMYITREALEECGYLNNAEKLKRCGMVMGAFGMPALEHIYGFTDLLKITVEVGMKAFLERDKFDFKSNKFDKELKPQSILTDTEPQKLVCEKLGISGPLVTLNAACSTPVFAMKEAIMYLLEGKADMMLAGAQCYNQMDFAISGMFDLLGILSKPGENKPLDKASQGVIAGSGTGMFVLKRLKDALEDGDNVLGVIESIGWASDGTTKFILAPDAEGQIRSYEDAYKDGVSPNIDYIECHATGTMAGDVVEIDSITRFFRERGCDPLLGALKGNTGHFFTASSHAAIAKVLMGFKYDMIPQTIRIKNPVDNKIVLENVKWQKKGDVKRAAINSFGFGGTNAHIVIREFNKEKELANLNNLLIQEEPLKVKKSNMAVVGLGMHIGDMDSVNKYYKYLLLNKEIVLKPYKSRWHEIHQNNPEMLKLLKLKEFPKGAYIYDYNFDFMEFKFPATGDDFYLRKDFILLNVAKEAMKDAGITEGSHPNTAVIINCGDDFSELNFMSTTELGDSIKESFKNNYDDINEDEIETLVDILNQTEAIRQTPTAVPGMMPNIRASRISAKWGFNGPAFIIMERENAIARSLEMAEYLMTKENIENVVIGCIELTGEIEHIYAQSRLGKGDMLNKYGISEGAVVIVLKNLDAAKRDGNNIYSVVNNVSINSLDNAVSDEERIKSSLDKILNENNVGRNEIGYVEIPYIVSQKDNKIVKDLLEDRYLSYLSKANCIESSVEDTIGYGFSLTSAVAMVKNCLQLYNGIKFSEKDGKYVTWNNEGKKRSSLISSFNEEGVSAHFILSSYDGEYSKKLALKNLVYPICAVDKAYLKERLDNIINLSVRKGMKSFYEETWIKYKEKNSSSPVLCLIADDRETLKKEASLALNNIDKFFTTDFSWESQNGSYFTNNPFGEDAKIVYMWPPGGMFNAVKFFENISKFPEYRKEYFDFINADFLTNKGIKGNALEDYIMEIISAQIMTKISTDKMGLKNHMVIGGSMGEIAPLFSLDSIKFQKGSTYYSLIGELVDVLSFMFNEVPKDMKSFDSWYVKGNKDELSELIEKEDSVFITIIGSLTDVVITGDGEACRRILNKFSGFGTQIKPATIIHSPLANDVYKESKADEFAEKISLKHDLDYKIYNACTLNPIDPDKDDFKKIFKNIITNYVNFLGVLEKSYEEGGRIYVDMSTNEVCEKWAKSTFKDKRSLILSLYSQRYNQEENFVRILAKLISNQVRFDLKSYLNMFNFEVSDKQKLEKKLNTSIQSFIEGLESEENRAFRESLSNRNKTRSERIQDELSKNYEAFDKVDAQSVITGNEYMKRYVNNMIVSNSNAYNLYLQSEQMILNNLLRNISYTSSVENEVKANEVKVKGCLWDLDDIIEMSKGSMTKILGPRYEEVDKYKIRARLPLPPFLFISRIMSIEAEYGELKPSKIVLEYDVTDDCILRIGDQRVSHVVLTESAQIGIFLAAYMGIDDISNGTLRFRAVDTKAEFYGNLPRIGETFRGVYELTTFLKQGPTMLVIYTYKCYIKDKLVMSLDGVGGFFTDQDLESKKGVIIPAKIDNRSKLMLERNRVKFKNYKSSYTKEELHKFYEGEWEGGIHHGASDSTSKQTIPPEIRLVDRITYLSETGGDFGLGEMIGEMDLDEDFWAFKSHFVNDPVYPVSLLLEGVNQMTYFIIDANIIGPANGISIEPVRNKPGIGKFRGQVRPVKSIIKYRISFKNFEENKDFFKFFYDVDIFWQDIHVVRCEDMGMFIEV